MEAQIFLYGIIQEIAREAWEIHKEADREATADRWPDGLLPETREEGGVGEVCAFEEEGGGFREVGKAVWHDFKYGWVSWDIIWEGMELNFDDIVSGK